MTMPAVPTLERSSARLVVATFQPSSTAPRTLSLGIRTPSKKTSLKSLVPVTLMVSVGGLAGRARQDAASVLW